MSYRRRSAVRVLCEWLVLASAACMLVPAVAAGGAPAAPEDGFPPGWVRSGPTMRFTPGSLFDYIDGGAELFLEFGFKELLVQRYSRGASELTLEIYRMESPEAALGIYLARSDAEAPVDGIRARNTGSPYQVTVLKGSVFLQVNNFEGGDESLPAMAALVNLALERVSRGKPVTLFENLPGHNLVPGSETLVRGQFGLQPIFTLGSGDVLLLGGKVFAVVGDYYEGAAGPDAATYTRLVVLYPGKSAARRAYSHLVANLDQYLEVLRTSPGSPAGSAGETGFVFRDYQGKFGSVRLDGRKMDIKVNLSKEQ